jgi:uncharacterized integral membrane protein
MGNLWLKIKVWTKIGVAALIVLYVLVFVLKNGGRKAEFWFWFNHEYEGSILSLVFFAFLIGGLVAMLATTTVRTIRQIKEIRARNRSEKLVAEVADMKAKAAMLQTRPGGAAAQDADMNTIPSPPPPRES